MAVSRGSTHDKVKAFALSLPGAYEDHPWGETVVKVNKKVFVFLGHEETPAERGMAVKLMDSHDQALMVPGARPTGYGLGRAGWVDVPMRKGPPLAVLKDWVEESYRIVAPKKLVAKLDAER